MSRSNLSSLVAVIFGAVVGLILVLAAINGSNVYQANKLTEFLVVCKGLNDALSASDCLAIKALVQHTWPGGMG